MNIPKSTYKIFIYKFWVWHFFNILFIKICQNDYYTVYINTLHLLYTDVGTYIQIKVPIMSADINT